VVEKKTKINQKRLQSRWIHKKTNIKLK